MQSFNDLALSPAVSRAITEMGFEKPSDIQAQALPKLLGEATDFIGLAATGTGKTAAFAIPLCEKLSSARGPVQSIILCPTRELALQVAGQVDLIGKYKNIRSLAIYGGAGYMEQFDGLRRGPAVVVGTPGRVIDHLKRGSLILDKVHTVILDEADEMISMGFKDEIDEILSFVAGQKNAAPRIEAVEAVETERKANIWLFSATMSREVRAVANRFLKDPQQVQINRTEMLSSTVEQYYYPTMERNKPEVLCKLIDAADDFFGIVFCQTKQLVTDLTQYLVDRGYKVDCLHGDKNQASRERTMQLFREHKVNILICTDVAARGLDVKDITHVINYSLPRELENYVHRIGRTARSGKNGTAMSLVTPAHRQILFRIESMTKTRMKEGKIPSRREVAAKKVATFLPKFKEQDQTALRALEVMGEEWKEALTVMSPMEVAARFLAFLNHDIFADKDLSMERPAAPARRDDRDERPRAPRADGPREARGDRFERGPRGPRIDGPRVDGPRFDGPRVDGPRPEGRFNQRGPEARPPRFDRDVEPRAPRMRDVAPPPIPRPRMEEVRPVAAAPAAPVAAPVMAPPPAPPVALEQPMLNRKQRRDLARAQGLIKPIFNNNEDKQGDDEGPKTWSEKASMPPRRKPASPEAHAAAQR